MDKVDDLSARQMSDNITISGLLEPEQLAKAQEQDRENDEEDPSKDEEAAKKRTARRLSNNS